MKKEDLFELLSDIDEKSVQEAQDFSVKKTPLWKGWGIYGALAAMIVLAVLIMPLFGKRGQQGQTAGVKTVLAAAPEAVGEGMSSADFVYSDAYQKWSTEQAAVREKASAVSGNTLAYCSALMQQVLASPDKNTVCSPLNTYFALAMLAETCGGNSRKQILDMLGAADIESLREAVSALWNANCVETPLVTSLLADSLWLDSSVEFKEATLQTLADIYHASSFRGKTGSGEMDKALQDWTNEATGGLLADYVRDLTLDPATVMALMSTLYYKTEWYEAFNKANTAPMTFHGAKGDSTVQMMKKDVGSYVRTDSFTAVGLSLKGGNIYFYLPNEDVSVNALLSDPDVLKSVSSDGAGLWTYADINLLLPRFKVSAKTDLIPTLEALGATDVLNPARADFSPLTKDPMGLYVGKAEHAAMVEIDEEGVTGAAYTLIALYKGIHDPKPEFDLFFDRPFLFMVTSADGSILFAGVVRNITE